MPEYSRVLPQTWIDNLAEIMSSYFTATQGKLVRAMNKQVTFFLSHSSLVRRKQGDSCGKIELHGSVTHTKNNNENDDDNLFLGQCQDMRQASPSRPTAAMKKGEKTHMKRMDSR